MQKKEGFKEVTQSNFHTFSLQVEANRRVVALRIQLYRLRALGICGP